MATKSMKQWVVRDKGSFDSLKLEEAPIPKVGEHDVLVKIHAVSLNYRDLMVATVSIAHMLLLPLKAPDLTLLQSGRDSTIS